MFLEFKVTELRVWGFGFRMTGFRVLGNRKCNPMCNAIRLSIFAPQCLRRRQQCGGGGGGEFRVGA